LIETVEIDTLKHATEMLARGEIGAFATNDARLVRAASAGRTWMRENIFLYLLD